MDFTLLDRYLDSLPDSGLPMYDCAVHVGYKEIYRRQGGYIDVAGRVRHRPHTRYFMYSATKPVTCAAALTLLEAGAHFGHLKRKWNPKMAPYIFMEKNGIHIIDLHKTAIKLDEAAAALKQIVKSGRRVLFVATKKQAKEIVAEKVAAVGMPYVTERWAGGMLTNFPTIRKAVKKMATIDKMTNDGTYDNFSKREKLQIARQRAKLEKNLGSIADLNRLPAALFVIDVQKEQNAVKEAKRLSIPVFAMVDTCCDPTDIDYVIPANDDAQKSIATILDVVCGAIAEGAEERKLEKEKEAVEAEANTEAPAKKPAKTRIKKSVKASVDAQEAVVAEVVAAVEE